MESHHYHCDKCYWEFRVHGLNTGPVCRWDLARTWTRPRHCWWPQSIPRSGKKSTLPPTYETHLTWQNCVHGKTNVNYSLWLSLFFACIVWHVFIRKEKSWEFLLSDTDTSVTSLPPWWGCPAMFIPCLAHHCITWHANSSLTLSLSAFQPRLALVSFLAAVIIWK